MGIKELTAQVNKEIARKETARLNQKWQGQAGISAIKKQVVKLEVLTGQLAKIEQVKDHLISLKVKIEVLKLDNKPTNNIKDQIDNFQQLYCKHLIKVDRLYSQIWELIKEVKEWRSRQHKKSQADPSDF